MPVFDEAVLAGAALAVDFLIVLRGDLCVGHFARARGESRELFGVMLELFEEGCPGLRAVDAGGSGRMAILAAAHGQSPEKAKHRAARSVHPCTLQYLHFLMRLG